jgi:hypothetical protein
MLVFHHKKLYRRKMYKPDALYTIGRSLDPVSDRTIARIERDLEWMTAHDRDAFRLVNARGTAMTL